MNNTNQKDSNFGYYYFKRDSFLIGIPERFSNLFVDLFKQAPDAFDSMIEKHSIYMFDKSQVNSRAYDPTLFLLNFKEAIIFFDLTVHNTKEGMTWTLESGKFDKPNRCYNKVYFEEVKYGKSEKYHFKSVSKADCEI